MTNYQDLLGKKYKLGGRGPDFYDCYGLCMEMYKRNGIEIPNHVSVYSFEEVAKKINENLIGWKKIEKDEATRTIKNSFGEHYLKPNSVAIIRMGRFGCHIVFIINELQFIHCWDKADDVIIERIDNWKNNILGIYKYE